MSEKLTRKQITNKQRQAFLLTFFEGSTKKYEEKEVNGFMLVKHIVNGDSTNYEVAIYPLETFLKQRIEAKKRYNQIKSNHLSASDREINELFLKSINDSD